MDIFFTIVNTILIAGMFLYQKNRNKVLVDRITEQTNLLAETKSVVLQQSTAIDSQKTVVDTALKYTESFDSERLEAIIRRELELDHKDEIEKIKTESKGSIEKTRLETTEKIVNLAMSASAEAMVEYLQPLVLSYVLVLISMGKEARHKIIDEIEDEFTRNNIKGLICKIENEHGDKLP